MSTPALGELQRAMRAALLGGDAERAAESILGDGLPPEVRLQIYAHHVLTSLTAALESTYPVVCRLVDQRFFGYAADRYIRAHPPSGPCLFEYGRDFADFLAAFPPCRELGYLPDVARLEWALNAAAHAPDAEPLDPGDLAAVAADEMPRLAFELDPSLSLLTSAWPVDRIWRANQGDAPADLAVDLDSGGARLEIRRRDGDVSMRALDPSSYALRDALARGRALEDAAGAALAIDPALDLSRALRELIDERILIAFRVSN